MYVCIQSLLETRLHLSCLYFFFITQRLLNQHYRVQPCFINQGTWLSWNSGSWRAEAPLLMILSGARGLVLVDPLTLRVSGSLDLGGLFLLTHLFIHPIYDI